MRIDELEGLFVCSDLAQDRPDAVPPVSASTRMVAAFTPEVAVADALDVGTGSGALALLMARRARRVVATDVSERALAFTRRNADLNGLDNVETRHGSFLEPVRGERFGLAVCNPPYVISPDTEFLYRDAGMRGDELCRRLLDELPDVLTGEGYATLQGNWTHPADGPWHPRARATALLTRIKTYTPREYAQSWCAAAHTGDPEGFTAAVERWTASYRELGIEAITLAIVVLRGGPPQRPWATTLHDRPRGLPRRLPALFAAAETLAHADVLDLRLRPAPGLIIERRRTPGGEERCVLVHPATPSGAAASHPRRPTRSRRCPGRPTSRRGTSSARWSSSASSSSTNPRSRTGAPPRTARPDRRRRAAGPARWGSLPTGGAPAWRARHTSRLIIVPTGAAAAASACGDGRRADVRQLARLQASPGRASAPLVAGPSSSSSPRAAARSVELVGEFCGPPCRTQTWRVYRRELAHAAVDRRLVRCSVRSRRWRRLVLVNGRVLRHRYCSSWTNTSKRACTVVAPPQRRSATTRTR